MRVLFFGGQKSGKSLLAEERALKLSLEPFYIATYDNSFGDEEMQKRVLLHQRKRADKFKTIEEPLYLSKVVKNGETYLIDCISMWILNTVNWSLEDVLSELDELLKREANLIFVLNDVGSGVAPIDRLSREFIDRSGIIGQKLAKVCDEVYEVKFGLKRRLK